MHTHRCRSLALAAALALGWGCADAQVPAARRGSDARAAHAAAADGYRLYADGDYGAAVEHARRAVRLAPERRAYGLLLAQALLASGRVDEAELALDGAAQFPDDATSLAPAYAALARLRALSAAEAMYRSLAADDTQAAILNGRRAVVHAPDNVPYRLLLTQALLREGRYGEAELFASEAIALRADDAAALALRAYARQGLARPAEAQADLELALARPGIGPEVERELRLLAADLALAQGQGARLLELLQPLAQDDAAAAPRREIMGGPPRATQAPAGFNLPVPAIDCSASDVTGSCALHAAGLTALPGYADASAGYAAMADGDPARAVAHARRATAAAPGHHRWRRLHIDAAQAAGELAEAEGAATAALELAPLPDPALLASRSWMRRAMGETAGAQADAETALRLGGLPPTGEAALLVALGRHEQARSRLADASAAARAPSEHVELGYLWIRAGNDAAAARAFAAADAGGALPPSALRDAGYAAMRSHADAQAVRYLERATAAAEAGQFALSQQQVLETRRTAAEIARTWGVAGSVTHRSDGGVEPGFGTVGGAGGAGDHPTTQAGVEAYWRPWGYRNGRYAEVFARGFATLDARDGTWTGGDSFQGAVGARWKPLAAHNLVVSLARVFGPNVDDSWLAQVGYSLDIGGELRLDVPSWWTTRFSAEAGKYLNRGDSYGIASATFGRTFRVYDERTTVYPHLFVGAEHQSDHPVARTSSGVGAGVGVRRWFREDAGRGPRSYWDLTLQYRARLSGDDRMKGLYVSAQFSF